MNLYSNIPSRTGLAVACGMLLTAGMWSAPARADQWDKKTILTVRDQPIQIRDTVLQPGQYVLRLLDSQSERHVVQIFNGDQTHIINTVIAIPATRTELPSRTQFTFWETPPGTAKAMRDWYYPGDTIGNEFPYPKHLKQIAILEPAPAPVAAAAAPAPEPAPAAEPVQQTETQSESVTQEPAPAEPPAEIAQNTAPAPATPEPQSTPSTTSERQLPKTGSQYPLFGLGGGVLLGLYGLLRLRLKQVA